MRIKNNPKIFYLACGLLAEGDRRYDANDAEVAALALKIRRAPVDSDILQWFNLAKTGQVGVNPYWPRGHSMLTGCFFFDDYFDVDSFSEFIEGTNMADPIGPDEFKEWIGRLPLVLDYAEGKFRDFWKEYCAIVISRMASWMAEIEASHLPLKEFFGKAVPNLVFAPNLFASPFAADFVRTPDDGIIVIACKPDVETILHEALHIEIAKHRSNIMNFAERYGIKGFANAHKMKQLGYMPSDSPISAGHVIEECFVRVLSVILSGGGEKRLQGHVRQGFSGLPAIAKYFKNHRPTSDSLGEFIDIILKGMV